MLLELGEELSVLFHTCNPSYSGGGIRGIGSSSLDKVSKILSQKENSVIEHLPSKCEALSSIPR
jgi:hypothetical protein